MFQLKLTIRNKVGINLIKETINYIALIYFVSQKKRDFCFLEILYILKN